MNADEVIGTTRRAWQPAMAPAEYGAFLNELLAAERAGAKLLSAYLDELPLGSPRWKAIRDIQRDEARNCAVLIHYLLEQGAVPSAARACSKRRRSGFMQPTRVESATTVSNGAIPASARMRATLP